MARTSIGRKKPEPVIKQLGVRATVDWIQWLERAAKFCRTDASKLIDASLVDYVKGRGFDEDPPPRL